MRINLYRFAPKELCSITLKLFHMSDYHAFTKGLENILLFRDEQDYIDGMNGIPQVLQKTQCQLLAFCLMSNHIHFVLTGNLADVRFFMEEYKRRIAMSLNERYNEVRPLHGMRFSIKEVDKLEYLRTVIAYVVRNPLGAGFKGMPYNYRWSSAAYYFQSHDEEGTRIEKLSLRKYRKILKTHTPKTDFIKNCTIDNHGMILPSHYLNTNRVNNIYGRQATMLYFMSKNDDERVEAEMSTDFFEMQDDTTIRKMLLDTCYSVFGSLDVNTLSYPDKLSLAGIVRRRFGATNKQLTRIMHIKIGN